MAKQTSKPKRPAFTPEQYERLRLPAGLTYDAASFRFPSDSFRTVVYSKKAKYYQHSFDCDALECGRRVLVTDATACHACGGIFCRGHAISPNYDNHGDVPRVNVPLHSISIYDYNGASDPDDKNSAVTKPYIIVGWCDECARDFFKTALKPLATLVSPTHTGRPAGITVASFSGWGSVRVKRESQGAAVADGISPMRAPKPSRSSLTKGSKGDDDVADVTATDALVTHRANEEQITALERHVALLEAENKSLAARLEQTESALSDQKFLLKEVRDTLLKRAVFSREALLGTPDEPAKQMFNYLIDAYFKLDTRAEGRSRTSFAVRHSADDVYQEII